MHVKTRRPNGVSPITTSKVCRPNIWRPHENFCSWVYTAAFAHSVISAAAYDNLQQQYLTAGAVAASGSSCYVIQGASPIASPMFYPFRRHAAPLANWLQITPF